MALGVALSLVGCMGAAPSVSPMKGQSPEAAKTPATEHKLDQAKVPPAPGEGLAIEGIKLVEDEGQSGVFIKLSRVPDKVEHFTLTDPNRLVIDIVGPVGARAEAFERAAAGDPKVDRVRVTRQADRLRVTVDLKGEMPPFTLTDLQTMVVAFLGERTGKPAPPRSQVLYAAAGEEAPKPVPRGAEVAVAAAEPTGGAPVAGGADVSQRLKAKQYTGEKISLDFKDADVLNVLRILAEVSGLNIVATDDVKGRVTVRLVDVPWDQALDIILQSNRLDAVQIGNVLRVSTVTRLKEEREAQLAAEEAAKELEPLKVAYIPVNYMKVDDKDDPLVKKLEDVITERGKVKTDARTNTVIVRDIQRGIDAARDLIRELDKQTPQVLIESNVVEATDTFTRDIGIQWGYSLALGPQFGNATGREFPSQFTFGGATGSGVRGDPGTFTGRAPGPGPAGPVPPGFNAGPSPDAPGGPPAVPIPFIADFPAQTVVPGEGSVFDIALGSIDGSKALNAKLSALEKEGKAKIISRPKVVTLNNNLAKIEAIRIFRVRLPSTGTVISTGAGGVAGSVTAATEQIRTGITLEVKPQVSSDGFILLDINVKSSTADFTQQVDNIPAEVSREARTLVLIKDGETVVLGGVFRNSDADRESGIPYLRNIPGLGWLFKRMFRDRQREELLVFLTPRIVQTAGAAFSNLPTARELWAKREG
jgi:type IV pilus assembly protein PilQ